MSSGPYPWVFSSTVLHISGNEDIRVNSNPSVMLWAPSSKSTPGLIMLHLLPTCLPTEAYCNRLLTDFPAMLVYNLFPTNMIRSFHSPAKSFPFLSCHVERKPTFLAVRAPMVCEATNRSLYPTRIYCVTTLHVYQPLCEFSCLCSPPRCLCSLCLEDPSPALCMVWRFHLKTASNVCCSFHVSTLQSPSNPSEPGTISVAKLLNLAEMIQLVYN